MKITIKSAHIQIMLQDDQNSAINGSITLLMDNREKRSKASFANQLKVTIEYSQKIQNLIYDGASSLSAASAASSSIYSSA